MHVLLPPSESKSPGGAGRSLSRRPAHPLLGAHREKVLNALDMLIAEDPGKAAASLLLPAGVAEAALTANTAVRASGTARALTRYTGVVYDGFGFAELPRHVQRIAARRAYIFSGLFGVVRGDELIPDYRVPAKASLPGLGVVGTSWRPVLDEVLPLLVGKGVVVDLRSSDYQAMWRPKGELATRTLTVRVLSPLPSGGVGVVSFPSKYAKGRLAAALFESVAAGEVVQTADDVARVWTQATGHGAEVLDATSVTLLHPAKVVGQLR